MKKKFIFEIITSTVTLTPKLLGFFCYPGWMCGPSLRKVGQGFLELLIGNEKVTDGQTTRLPCAKQYALSSSKGGIKSNNPIFEVLMED